MRYFSEITPISENYKARQMYIRESLDSKARLVLRDTEDTSFIERDVRPSSAPYRDALGYSANFGGVVLMMDYKRAKLHDFITLAETISGVSPIVWDDVDKAILGCKYSYGREHRGVAIDALKSSIKIDGSVCAWNGDSRDVCCIYDMLGRLCRELSCNVMRYEYIKIYNSDGRYKTIVELANSAEAQRFFMKMYLDVSSSDWSPL